MAELGRLRKAGMGTVAAISAFLEGGLSVDEAKPLIGRGSVVNEFLRVARAVRQIIVLEQELEGLRPAPDRDATPKQRETPAGQPGAKRIGAHGESDDERDDLDDYDKGPLDRVVARVRKALKVAPPADDPFAPPADRPPRPQSETAVGRTAGGKGPPRAHPPRAVSMPPAPVAKTPRGGNFRPKRDALMRGAASRALGPMNRGRGPPSQ